MEREFVVVVEKQEMNVVPDVCYERRFEHFHGYCAFDLETFQFIEKSRNFFRFSNLQAFVYVIVVGIQLLHRSPFTQLKGSFLMTRVNLHLEQLFF